MQTQLLKTGGILIDTTNNLICHFPVPRLVINTSQVHGGFFQTDTIFHHHITDNDKAEQANEFSFAHLFHSVSKEVVAITARNSLKCEGVVGFLSNANMACHGYSSFYSDNMIVEVLATAVVEANAVRAGDPRRCDNLLDGAINLLVLTNVNMDQGNMVKALVTITEAKSAVLQELAVISFMTNYPSTGTGKDGVIFAVNPAATINCADTGTQSQFGEILAQAVKTALKKTMALESKINPWRQSMIEERLWRLGFGEMCSTDLPSCSTAKVQIILAASEAIWQEYCWGLIGIDGLYQFFSLLESKAFQPVGIEISIALRQKIAATVCIEKSKDS